MSVAGVKKKAMAVTATDLLGYTEEKLIEFLRTIGGVNYDITGVSGVMELPMAKKNELADKLDRASSRLDLGVDLLAGQLQQRLADLADKQTASPELRPRRMSVQSSETDISERPFEYYESANRERLILDGGRPVCSIDELSRIVSEPMTRYKKLLSWLTADPDDRNHPNADIGTSQIRSVFARQFRRWWEFRKSQWVNRGIGESEEGISAFLEATKCRDEAVGEYMEESFDESTRYQWKRMPAFRQLPYKASFADYRGAMAMRLQPYQFNRSPQLRKNPHHQDAWTNWLEYLNFEKWYLEKMTSHAESLEPRFRECWQSLNARAQDVASSQGQANFKHSQQNKDLKAVQADRDASNKAITEFLEGTKKYQIAQADAYYQRHRVSWVVREARLLEAEIAAETKRAKQVAAEDKKEKRKRQREEEDEAPTESRSKRAKSGAQETAPNSAPRRSARIARVQNKS